LARGDEMAGDIEPVEDDGGLGGVAEFVAGILEDDEVLAVGRHVVGRERGARFEAILEKDLGFPGNEGVFIDRIGNGHEGSAGEVVEFVACLRPTRFHAAIGRDLPAPARRA